MNPDDFAASLGGSVVGGNTPQPSQNTPPQNADPVDAFAASLGGQSVPTTPNPAGGIGDAALGAANFVGRTLNNAEQPFVSVAATPVQLGLALYNKLTGSNIPDPYQKGIQGFAGDQIPVASATTLGGLSQKAAQTAQIATTALGPAASGVRALSLLGAASGAAQGLSEGNANPMDVVKDTISGGMFGAATGVGSNFLRWMGGVEKAKTGIVGQVANEIQKADPTTVQSYIDTTLNHANDVRVPTPDALASQAMAQRADILMNKVIPDAGKAVGAARDAAGNVPIMFDPGNGVTPASGTDAVSAIRDDINGVMQNLTGHQFASYGEGEAGGLQINNYPQGASATNIEPVEGNITQLPGRSIQISATDRKALEGVDEQLKLLQQNPTVQTASDVMKNLDAKIDWNRPQFGEGSSPVDGVIRYARGAINRTIAPAAADLAQANETWGNLMDLKAEIGAQGGKNLQGASLFMRRVLSGDKSSDVIPTLDQLSQITQPYMPAGDNSNLVQHAVLADWAKKTFGDTSTSGLLQQSMSRGVNDASSIFGYPKQFVRNMIQGAIGAVSPDPAAYAMSVAKGEPYSMNPAVRGIDELLDSPNAKPIKDSLMSGLKGMGVSAANLEPAANALFKTWLLTTLTHPANMQSAGGGGITGFVPADVPQRSLTP